MTQFEEPLQLTFQQTGDSWHSWGLCELYELLLTVFAGKPQVKISEPTASGFSVVIAIETEEFADLLHRHMAGRWNELHPRFEEGKKIPGCEPRTENGRRVTGEKNDAKFVKENWKAYDCNGNPPSQPRNKCQRLTNLPLNKKVLDDLLDTEGGAKSFKEMVLNALKGAKGDLKQEGNPLTANHHSNGKVRGPAASNSGRVEHSIFLLPCYCASLSAWKPFVTSPPSNCTVYLPDNIPFDRALRLWKNLRVRALIHPDRSGGQMYRNLPIWGDGEEAQLLILLDALISSLPVRIEPDELGAEDIPELNNWTAISFSSGTGVSVGSIHRIEVPAPIFDLLNPILPPAYWKNQAPVTFVRDCLAGIRVEDVPIQSHFAQALFLSGNTDRWKALEKAAFSLYKNVGRANTTNRRASSLIPHFMSHFAKEMNIFMQDNQLEACRKIGVLAGRAFSSDVTMLSRLHNSASPEDLRSNLSLLTFRLFKASTDDEKKKEMHRIALDEFEQVLELANGPNWVAAGQTISLFACLTAFNKNLGEPEKSDKA